MDLSRRRMDFLDVSEHPYADKIFLHLIDYFDEQWLQRPEGRHRLQNLSKRRDALSTIELLNLADAIYSCRDVDDRWLDDIRRKIKLGDINQQNGAFSELMFLGMLRKQIKEANPAPINQKGYDVLIKYADGIRFYLSVKRFGKSSPEKEFSRRANEYLTKLNNKIRNRVNTVHVHLAFKDYAESSDWHNAECAALLGEIPLHCDNEAFSINVSPLTIPGYEALSKSHFSYWYLITSKEHRNEQVNFIEKVRQAASELNKKVPRDGTSHSMLLVHLHSTASLNRIHRFAESYLQTQSEGLDGIVLYQPFIIKEQNTTTLTHALKIAVNPSSQNLMDRLQKHPLHMEALIGRSSSDGIAWKLLTIAGDTTKSQDQYIYQRGEYFVPVANQGNGQASGVASNPFPGVRQHLTFDQAVIQGLFPESDDLEIL